MKSADRKKIKLLFVLVGLEIGGVEVFLSQFLNVLDKEKYDITVCCFKSWGIVGDLISRNGVRVITLNGKSKYSFGVVFKIFRLIYKKRYAIVQSQLYLANVVTGFVVALVRVIAGKRSAPLFISNHREMGEWHKWYHHLLLSLALRFADARVSCSEAVRKKLIGDCRIRDRKNYVIYNGVSQNRFFSCPGRSREVARVEMKSNCERESPFTIGAIGRLQDNVKGFTFLIEAISQLHRKMDNVCLIIVGDGPDREQLEEIVERLDLKEKVKFAGATYAIQDFIGGLDLLVIPSLSEGFPNVALEAMFFSKPIVATNVGGIPEVVVDRETGILVSPKDSEALATAIQYLKEHPVVRREMGIKGKQRVEEYFTIEKTAVRYETLYDNLISERT